MSPFSFTFRFRSRIPYPFTSPNPFRIPEAFPFRFPFRAGFPSPCRTRRFRPRSSPRKFRRFPFTGRPFPSRFPSRFTFRRAELPLTKKCRSPAEGFRCRTKFPNPSASGLMPEAARSREVPQEELPPRFRSRTRSRLPSVPLTCPRVPSAPSRSPARGGSPSRSRSGTGRSP